ncbi:MAG: CD225/dispanin family protein [bacterium]
MNCPQCGAENADGRYRCSACGAWLRQGLPLRARPPNYLVPAVLCTIFCCVPFGIAAVVHAAQATSNAAAGDLAAAHYAAEKARMWCWIAFWTQLGMGLLWVLVAIVGGLLGRMV